MKTALALMAAICLMASCRSTRKIQTAIAKKDTVTSTTVTPVPHEDSAAIIRQTLSRIHARTINYTTFSAKKVNVDYQGADGKKYNVNATLRMYKDSVIWISITAIFGIEGLRAYITKDSVKILNKQDKVYTARSVAYLQEVTALPLDLHTLQDILVGNPVFLDTTQLSYTRSGTGISLLSYGEWFKNLLTLNDSTEIQNSKLDDIDPARSRTCNLNYDDYEDNNGVDFSTKRRITVAEKSNLDIKLDFKQYSFNETLSFPFTIPKSYKRN